MKVPDTYLQGKPCRQAKPKKDHTVLLAAKDLKIPIRMEWNAYVLFFQWECVKWKLAKVYHSSNPRIKQGHLKNRKGSWNFIIPKIKKAKQQKSWKTLKLWDLSALPPELFVQETFITVSSQSTPKSLEK